ncbi:MAG: nuclear transport factor 2 family protein [bacterium]|nr:nuclear transport factor 2 family protein [bacterium]
MKKQRTLVAFVLTALLCSGAVATAGETVSKEIEEQIIAWNDDLEDAYVRGDAAAIAALFTEDATVFEPMRPAVHGREAIREYFQYYLDFGVEEIRSRTDEIYGDDESVMEIGRNHAYVRGERTPGSRYMCLYKKVDGRWLAHRVVGSN